MNRLRNFGLAALVASTVALNNGCISQRPVYTKKGEYLGTVPGDVDWKKTVSVGVAVAAGGLGGAGLIPELMAVNATGRGLAGAVGGDSGEPLIVENRNSIYFGDVDTLVKSFDANRINSPGIHTSTRIGIVPFDLDYKIILPSADNQKISGAIYQWTFDNKEISKEQSGRIRISSPGDHTLKLHASYSDGSLISDSSYVIKAIPRLNAAVKK